MSSVQVGELGLKLVTPGSMRPEAASLRSRAEQAFMPAVLRAMVRRLEPAFGAKAVIRIRSLRIKCGMRASDLDGHRFGEQLCEELAALIVQMAPGRPRARAIRLPAASATVQVYRDKAQWQAARLIAAACRRREPGGTRQDFGRLWAETSNAKPASLRRILQRCLEAKGLGAVLARLDGPALARLEAIVAIAGAESLHAHVRKARAARPAGADGPSTRIPPRPTGRLAGRRPRRRCSDS